MLVFGSSWKWKVSNTEPISLHYITNKKEVIFLSTLRFRTLLGPASLELTLASDLEVRTLSWCHWVRLYGSDHLLHNFSPSREWEEKHSLISLLVILIGSWSQEEISGLPTHCLSLTFWVFRCPHSKREEVPLICRIFQWLDTGFLEKLFLICCNIYKKEQIGFIMIFWISQW